MNHLESIQKQINNYLPILTEKLQDLGQNTIPIIQPENAQQGVQFILQILDEVIQILTNLNVQYSQLEQQLQQYEGECRNHIRTEQRLKLHCENIQELYEQQLNTEKELKISNASFQKEIQQLKKELDELKYSKTNHLQQKTTSLIDKILLEQQKQSLQVENKSRSNTLNNNFITITNQRQSIPIKINNNNNNNNNRKNRLVTEYQESQTISKQSMDEKLYQSLEKIQQEQQNCQSRPKSKLTSDSIIRKSITLHVGSQKGKQLKRM